MMNFQALNICQFFFIFLSSCDVPKFSDWLLSLIGPSAPRNAQLTDKKATSLKVTWLSPEFPNGIIKKYRIIYSNNTGKNYTVEVTKGLNNATLFYTISGLQKDTDYQIYVSVCT